MHKRHTLYDYRFGFAALFSVIFSAIPFISGYGIRLLFPAFDGLPLFFILLAALAVACAVNRIAAKSFAQAHFGMPPEERRALFARHAQECRQDPEAVLSRYRDMETVPVFLLSLYFLLAFAIGVTPMLCLHPQCGFGRILAAMGGWLVSWFLFFAPILCRLELVSKGLNRRALVPVGALPALESMARRAADAVGIRKAVRLELTRECDCDVNRIGKTYVVFLGTRLLTALTEEELFQLLLISFDYFSHPKAFRQVMRRYRLGSLGAADVHPFTFAFDLYFSYADATLEWEYELYTVAFKQYVDGLARERICQAGNPAAAVSGMGKRAMWRYFVFESNEFITTPFYEPETPAGQQEWSVCHAFRRALEERHGDWLDMLSREICSESERFRPLFRQSWPKLTPEQAVPSVDTRMPSLDTPYGAEVKAAVDLVEARLTRELTPTYEAARDREYLEPLRQIRAYEASPDSYSTPELSPVINAYRDVCRLDEAEALCDAILVHETNPFATAHALYFKGMRMLHRYDSQGVDLIYRAIDLNKNYMNDGFEMVEEYCTLCGLTEEYETFRRRAQAQMSAHAYNHEGASFLSPSDHLTKEEALGDMLPDILSYMEQVSEGCIREIYLVRKTVTEEFFTSAFVLNFEYGAEEAVMRRAYEAIFNYLDAYPVDWQFSLFVYDRETERAVRRVEGSLVWQKKPDQKG